MSGKEGQEFAGAVWLLHGHYKGRRSVRLAALMGNLGNSPGLDDEIHFREIGFCLFRRRCVSGRPLSFTSTRLHG